MREIIPLAASMNIHYGMIRNEALKWNRKRVLRIYRSMKLGLRRKRKRRVPARIKQPLQKQQQPNKSYSMDFMSDALITGRKLRVLNVMDDCTRESLAAYADFSIPAEKMVSVLDEIIAANAEWIYRTFEQDFQGRCIRCL
jgi:putative transposase